VRLLADPTTIELTESIILPNFLRRALAELGEPALA
jgi:homoserine O-succinyltransferase